MRQRRTTLGPVLAGVALWASADVRAAEPRSRVAGTWKLVMTNPQGQEIALAIIKIDVKDGKTEAAVVATGPDTFKDVTVMDARSDDDSVHWTLKSPTAVFRFAAYAPTKPGRPKALRGSFQVRNSCEIVVLERTTDRELDPNSLVSNGAGADELKKLNTDDDKKLLQVHAAILEKYFDRPAAYVAARRVFSTLGEGGRDHKLLRAVGEQYRRLAADYGRETELHAATQIASTLVFQTDGVDGPFGALDVARRAEKLLNDRDPPAQQLAVLKVLLAALRKTNPVDAAAVKAVEARIAKLEAEGK
jgi:hypothetical protein